MSYGIDATNDQALAGIALADNPNQMDVTLFTDCAQTQSTVPLWLDGGNYYAATASGGAYGTNTAIMLNAFGYTGCSGVISLQTGTTNNATGYAYAATTTNLLAGMPTPSADLITKYEYETLVRTTATIHSNTVRGTYRLGFQNTTSNTAPTRGVFFQFLCDGTTTDTNWMVVFRGAGGTTRVDTGVAVSINTTYRLYLSTEVNSAGTFTTNYKIKNMTTGTNTEGTASPSATNHYPSVSSGIVLDYIGSVIINSKQVTATATSIVLYIDYIGTRIRKPLTREILIAP
jgi:hypothetical protein